MHSIFPKDHSQRPDYVPGKCLCGPDEGEWVVPWAATLCMYNWRVPPSNVVQELSSATELLNGVAMASAMGTEVLGM